MKIITPKQQWELMVVEYCKSFWGVANLFNLADDILLRNEYKINYQNRNKLMGDGIRLLEKTHKSKNEINTNNSI